ncbi:putative protein phosphatase 2C 75 [Bidens hawaiensis]|uniref:putative protein phosphatase 2C 75 n=1 Tax=Bidens hawaiensis TaxID=980011 RepID=UPI00404A0E61
MTWVHRSRRSLMPTHEGSGSTIKRREHRRRRIEMRRRLASSVSPNSQKLATADALQDEISEKLPMAPVYGSMSVVGRAREMEDEIMIKMNFCRPEINRYQPVHFFGVFDGHGGHHVSALCKDNMHVIMSEELTRVKSTSGVEPEALWKTAIDRSFERMDAMALTLCQCNGLENNLDVCRHHPRLSVVGSTAVVVLLTQEYIVAANCGDSRAVLGRNGKAVPLSVDHKPDRADERARIEALGGRVTFAANVARVDGVLAMSRAIGDRFLKRVVTSVPEFVFMKRDSEDISLVLASDGLWDVVSSELCCELVHKCQQEDLKGNLGLVAQMAVHGGGSLYTMAAAALLVRLAMGRRSTDNISVIVVDLRG